MREKASGRKSLERDLCGRTPGEFRAVQEKNLLVYCVITSIRSKYLNEGSKQILVKSIGLRGSAILAKS